MYRSAHSAHGAGALLADVRGTPPPRVWPAVLLFYAILLPPEVKVQFSTLTFYGYRIWLFIATPLVLVELYKGRVRLGPREVFIIATALWLPVAFIVNLGFDKGVESGGVLAFDFLGAYFIGRCYLRSGRQIRTFLHAVLPGVVAAGAALLIESASGKLIIRPIAEALLGASTATEAALRVETRMGFARAYGPFPHPILAGLVMTSLLPLYWISLRRTLARTAGSVAALSGIFSFSSAAIIGASLNVVLILFYHAQRVVKDITWRAFLGAVIASLFVVHLFSQNGVFNVIIRYLTFDSGTGYFRLLIWKYGGEEVARNPFFGIGFESYTRPSFMFSGSIDAHWLAAAVQNGLPFSIALLGITLWLIVTLASQAGILHRHPDHRVLVALCVSLSTLVILMFTVTLWANALCWFNLCLGSAAGLARSSRLVLRHKQHRLRHDLPPTPAAS